MRRDISLISNARVKNNLEEGIKLIYEALRRQEAPVNAALFWYNLMCSGEIYMRSRLAACPALNGIKWTAIKWFHERGRECRRPYDLNQFDQERCVNDLDSPEPKHRLNIRSEAKKSTKIKNTEEMQTQNLEKNQ
ncbi:unnamed protein product [Onchocerca flexuosa]|uniref:SCP domain-containing protein n=1 Tax=Onchocerca flexuosa TaxID=387005 RepID=A0A183HAF6_9BILA|nr:unnamed protein product [Onchocerca flexuosa]